MEVASAAKMHLSRNLPDLPTTFAPRPAANRPVALEASAENQHPDPIADAQSGASEELELLVIGESSARGEPYHPWLSVGQIVGWQLERVFPGRRVHVDVRAEGGLTLQHAVNLLPKLTRRPDAIIVFSGNNEFQAPYGWSRNVRHYVEEGPEHPLRLIELARSASSTATLILNTLDRLRGEKPPPPNITRELVDHPTCAPEEFAFLVKEFRRRLGIVAEYCQRIGAVPILIAPASNDGSFEPSRSFLSGSTAREERAAFAREFQMARKAERVDLESALAAYRHLVKQHPEFAECHYRLGQLLVRTGNWNDAQRHFILARDLDGLPLRCPTPFREAYREVVRRYGAVLIDGPELLARLSPHGILDDHLFHDAQHLNLAGYVALAQAVLEQLERRRAFGWPAGAPVPCIELDECANHFQLDGGKWAAVCERSRSFYQRTAYTRYDPSERLELARQYERASRELLAGHPLQGTGLPSLDLPISIAGRRNAPPAATAAAEPSS